MLIHWDILTATGWTACYHPWLAGRWKISYSHHSQPTEEQDGEKRYAIFMQSQSISQLHFHFLKCIIVIFINKSLHDIAHVFPMSSSSCPRLVDTTCP